MKKSLMIIPLVLGIFLVGCDRNRNPAPANNGIQAGAQFTVSVRNNFANQPLSQLAIVTSTEMHEVFQLATSASPQLEILAEEGNNQPLLDAKRAEANVDIAVTGAAPIPPGQTSPAVTITTTNPNAKYLTVASMLVNTNDGFIAEETDLSTLAVNETRVILAPAWDAGTELNSELIGTIPGPAGGTPKVVGTTRDDIVDFISTHRGVISNQDGLDGQDGRPLSVLTGTEKFLNPSARIIIRRIR